jgi:Zn-dependent protease
MGESGMRFNVAGFPVSLPLGGIIGVLLIAYLWTPNFEGPGRNGLLLASVFAVLLYLGVLLHELAHAWAAKAFGYPVHGITLWLLGGYTVYERRDTRPGPELVISLSGPFATLVFAAACGAVATNTTGTLGLLAGALAWTNLLLGVLNLLPGAPLDGGGIVKAAVWKLTGSETKGSRAAGVAGLVIAALLALFTVWALVNGGTFLLLTLVLAGFIGFGAYQSIRSSGVREAWSQVAGRIPQLIRPVMTVSQRENLQVALERWDRARQPSVVTVDDQGRLLAVLAMTAVDAVPQERRSTVEVGPFTVAIPAEQRAVLAGDPMDLIQAMASNELSILFITDEAMRPLGVLKAADVNAALQA